MSLPPRPPISGHAIDPTSHDLVMQQMDADSYTGQPSSETIQLSKRLGCAYKVFHDGVPIMKLYGVTDAGNSVLVHVHGYEPYFYVRAPPGFSGKHCDGFRSTLDADCLRVSDGRNKKPRDKEDPKEVFVRHVEICSR